MARSKVKSRLHHDAAHLHPLTNVPTKYQFSYTSRFPRYRPDKILWVKVTMAKSKVKLRADHDVAHLHPNQCPYQDFIGQGHYGEIKGQIKVRP